MKIALPVGGVGAVAVVQPEVVGGVGFEALLEKALRGPLAALCKRGRAEHRGVFIVGSIPCVCEHSAG